MGIKTKGPAYCLRDMSIKHKIYETGMLVLVKSLYIDCSIEPIALQTTRNFRNLPCKIFVRYGNVLLISSELLRRKGHGTPPVFGRQVTRSHEELNTPLRRAITS